jgi:hypothetical protein
MDHDCRGEGLEKCSRIMQRGTRPTLSEFVVQTSYTFYPQNVLEIPVASAVSLAIKFHISAYIRIVTLKKVITVFAETLDNF